MMTSIGRLIGIAAVATAILLPFTAHDNVAWAATAPVVSTLSSITEGVSTPVRAATDQLGNFYVSDPRGGGILVYNNAGKLQRKITLPASPMGIAIALNGDLLVSQGSSVAVVNPITGTIASMFGTFKKANAIAVDLSGFVYVTDSLDNCVQVFSAAYAPAATGAAAAGKPANSFGSAGKLNGQFLQPTGISYEKAANQLAVADTLNGRVQFFTTSGLYQKSIGSLGAGPLKFTSPQAVAFEYSSDGKSLSRIYVADSFQSNLQVIDAATGSFSRYIGSYGLTGGKLVTPGDVLFDRFDSNNKRLLVSNGTGVLSLFGIDGAGTAGPSTGPLLTVNTMPLATNLPALAITGTVASGATVTVNGTAAVITGTSWSSTVNLVAGFNLITVTAQSSSGSTVKTFGVNAIAPAANQVALTVNPLPAVTKVAGITLSGGVDTGSTVLVNGTPAVVSGTSWSIPVTLLPGGNNFLITASNTAMTDSRLSINITLDNIAPLLSTVLPPNGSTTSRAVLSIAGTVTDASPSTVTVTLNGVDQRVPVSDGMFSLAVVLAGGANVIAVSAVDAAGNSSGFASSTINYSPISPNINLTTASGSVTDNPVYTIAGTAPSGSTVTVNGAPVTLDGTVWSSQVNLSAGINYVVVKATGSDGLSSTTVVPVTLGQNLPIIAVTSPSQDLATASPVVSVEGTAGNGSVVTATVNGASIPVTMTANGGFSAVLPALTTPGDYVVVVSAMDGSGNMSTVTRSVVYDPSIPAISVLSSIPPKVTATGGVLVARDKNGPVGSATVAGGISTLDLTGVSYDPSTLNIFCITAAGISTRDGDINIDGKVDIFDALLALRMLVGLEKKASFQQMLHGDVGPIQDHLPTVDSQVRMSDVVVIMEKVVGLGW